MDPIFHFPSSVIAHRGASAYAPENTMAAFVKAAQLGVKWVEFDVMQARTGEPIVFHDETLARTTSGQGYVGDDSYAQLLSLDAGRWFSPTFSGERIPLLSDVIGFLKEMQMFANVELKPLAKQEETVVIRALEVIQSFYLSPYPSILFSSFCVRTLRFLRNQSPDCNIGLLVNDEKTDWEKICKELNCISVHVNADMMTEDWVTKIKAMGKLVLCYTVNDPKRAEELFSWGVDAVFSDAPDRIRAF